MDFRLGGLEDLLEAENGHGLTVEDLFNILRAAFWVPDARRDRLLAAPSGSATRWGSQTLGGLSMGSWQLEGWH